MKQRYLAAALAGLLFLNGCSHEEEDRPKETEKMISNAVQLSDGTFVDAYENLFDRMTYRTKDGTDLLIAFTTKGPEHVYAAGAESFEVLNEETQKKVLAYYEAQGERYDLLEELERAYADYKENREEFSSYLAGQETMVSASTQRLMYFTTIVQHPIDGKTGYEEMLGAVFDRETGENIRSFDLFLCEE